MEINNINNCIKITNCSQRVIFYTHIHNNDKLNLVLDLDQTLIDCENLLFAFANDTAPKKSELYIYNQNSNYAIHGRKNLFNFLFEMKDKFNIYIYTNATENYSHEIINHIENKFGEQIFSGIISRDVDNYYNLMKKLCDFSLRNISEFNTIIIDDRNDIWNEKYHCNIIKILEFNHVNFNYDDELNIIKNLLNKYHTHISCENIHLIISHMNYLYNYCNC